jgi:hypothetical protein
MIIDINQKKMAIGDKYRIYIDEKETHSASSVLFTFLSEIDLFENSSGKTKLTLKKRWSWFKTKYDIYKYDYSKFEYRTISLWKGHYQCLVGKDLYEIFCHKGRKHSVYKNNIQVAWWDKNCVTWFEGDNYKIIADDDSDFELLMSFCLINDNQSSNSNNKNAVTFDLGRIGAEAKKFNVNWKSKKMEEVASY